MLWIVVGVLAIGSAMLWPRGAMWLWIGIVGLLFLVWGLDILVRG